jgi:geranylgeranyl diphosphate synthase type II
LSSTSSASFDLAPYLAAQLQSVEAALARALDRVTHQATPRLREAMAYSLLGGGKRLRPVLVRAAAAALAVAPDGAELSDFGCALEMVHTYSLIHDDLPCMDDDDLRRGRPTSHKVFGEALALLAGDALLTEAHWLVSDGATLARLRLTSELAQAAGARGMVGGQVDDVAGLATDIHTLANLHARKTGALIGAACRGPALLDGQQPHLDALTGYGALLGVAFQIADDLLDATGNVEATGKQVGKDAEKGRVTYPGLLGVDGARAAARAAVDQAVARLTGLPGDTRPLVALAEYTLSRDR